LACTSHSPVCQQLAQRAQGHGWVRSQSLHEPPHTLPSPHQPSAPPLNATWPSCKHHSASQETARSLCALRCMWCLAQTKKGALRQQPCQRLPRDTQQAAASKARQPRARCQLARPLCTPRPCTHNQHARHRCSLTHARAQDRQSAQLVHWTEVCSGLLLAGKKHRPRMAGQPVGAHTLRVLLAGPVWHQKTRRARALTAPQNLSLRHRSRPPQAAVTVPSCPARQSRPHQTPSRGRPRRRCR
jgi:hypothetical protein